MKLRTLLPISLNGLHVNRSRTKRLFHFVAVLFLAASANAADVVWIGGTGDWNAPGNWSPAQVPGTTDNAIITNAGTYTVTIDKPDVDPTVVASLIIGGGVGTQSLSVGNVVLTLNGASVINSNGQLNITATSSEVICASDVTVDGVLNWASGTMTGAGVTRIRSGGVLNISGNATLLSRTLNNGGTVNWTAGNLNIDSGAVVSNLAAGIFNVGFDGRASTGGTGGGVFNNAGNLHKTAGTLTANIILQFNNTGTVDVQTGTLSLDAGGSHTGTFNIAASALVGFGGGAHVLSSGSMVTGTGVLKVTGAATLTANGPFDTGTTLNVVSGTATLSPSCNVTAATMNISGTGGTVVYNSSGTVGTVNITAGTLGGGSPVNVTGLLTVSGGSITNALVTANGGLNISGGFTLNGGKLINPGTAIWSAGNFTGANGAVFSNLLGATFINTFDGNAPTGAGATPTFVNAGLFQKTGATAPLGATSIDFQFLNTGTVEVQTNTLRYNFNQQTAGLTLLDGGGLTAQAQPLQILGGSLVGTGLVTVANIQNVINSSAISPGLPLGELDIAGNYQQTASGTLNIDLAGYTPGTTFDLITVAAGGGGGVATLGGTLNITITNGFSPTNGATFTFLTANSRVGAFATFNYPSNDIGMTVILGTTTASVKVTNLKPVVANAITNPPSATYGTTFNYQFAADTFSDPDNNPLSYTASGMPTGITFDGPTRTFSGAPSQTGVFHVTVFAKDNGTPNLTATNAFTISVNPAGLAITADAQNKSYGAADPALTYTVSGLHFSDTPATVLTGALARAIGETVAGSPYAITQGTLAANVNYTINFTNSALTITPATLAIAAQPKSKIYGTADPALTFTVGGLQFSESATNVLTGALARATGESVAGNPYAITQGTLAASGNYSINFTGNSLTITSAALSITADSTNKIYGAPDPAFTASYSGFVNLENPSVLAGTLAFNRAVGENVGDHLIAPGGLTNANYDITYHTGTLNITKAPLSISASNTNKVYGAADPTFTVINSGFVNGDNASVLSGTLTFNRASGENIGDHLITPSGQTNGNYTITFNTGTLTITKATLTVSADPKSKTYGDADPALTFTVGGLQFSDAATNALTGALTRTTGETVSGGPYAITQGTLTPNTNYTINFTGNSLTITRAALSVTANSTNKVYGASDPVFTASYSGFANSENPSVLAGTLTFTRAPGENFASYLITPGGLTNGNYAITFTTGTLNITKAVLSVVADHITKTFGTGDPALTFVVTGLKFSDSEASVLTGVLTRVAGETLVGNPYTVKQGTLTPNANYTINFTGNVLTITAPPPLMFSPALVGTNVVISWSAVTNGNYRVQYKPALTTTNWADLAGDVTATNSTASKTDIQTSTNRFYRIQVLP